MAIQKFSDGSTFNTVTKAVTPATTAPASGGSYGSPVSSSPAPASPAPVTNSNGSKNIVNPGSVYQTYDPKTGVTTYGDAPTGLYSGAGPAVETPSDLPSGVGSPKVAQADGTFAPLSSETAYVKNEKGEVVPNAGNKYSYKMPTNITAPAATDKTPAAEKINPADTTPAVDVQTLIDQAKSKGATGIAALLQSGQEFNETDAKNYATYTGETNWQKYVGGMAGKENPLYIGATNFAALQKKYTPYQISQATVKTNGGIYWNPDVNIADVPTVDPIEKINQNSNKIGDMISKAKESADITKSESAKKDSSATDETADESQISSDSKKNEEDIMAMLNKIDPNSAENTYNSLFNTDEIKDLQSKKSESATKLKEYDQQISELQDDIRSEVEGEAPESYITALATVRGSKILKLKNAEQIQYDSYTNQLSDLKQNATALLQAKTTDDTNRYNRLFSMLQLQLQQEGQAFNQEIAIANIGMNLPEGRQITLGDGTVVKGVKENDNLNILSFQAANGDTYAIGVDKTTGKQMYKTYIGRAAIAGSGGRAETPVDQYNNYIAGQNLAAMKDMNSKIALPVTSQGAIRSSVNQDKNDKNYGKTFYYDANSAYNDKAVDLNGSPTTKKGLFEKGNFFGVDKKLTDYLLYYAQ